MLRMMQWCWFQGNRARRLEQGSPSANNNFADRNEGDRRSYDF